MGKLHIGTDTTLAAVPAADCSNGDIAYIWLNGCNVKMVYNSTATNATDISDPPTTVYHIRPDDYGAAGVWVEDVGSEETQRWSMDQIRTGELVIDDNGSIHTANKTSYADTDDGFFFGYDTDGYKINFGDANSYIKRALGAMAIKMANGETFDLYGSLNVYDGGDITVAQGGDVILEGGGSGDPSLLRMIDGATGSNAQIRFEEDNDSTTYWSIQKLTGSQSDYLFIGPSATMESDDNPILGLGLDGSGHYAEYMAMIVSEGIWINTSGDPSALNRMFLFYDDGLEIGGNRFIGVNSVNGRIQFDSAVGDDDVQFLDCVVGIGTTTPSRNADLTLEGGAICLKERTTPTADTDYGKIYPKSDNKLYFQDGAGTEHELAFV